VVGTIDELNYVGSVTNTLTIAPASASVTLLNLSQTYDGTGRVVSATTVPENLAVTITYAGEANAPTNAGSYEVVGTIAELNYTGSVTNTLVVVGPAVSLSIEPMGSTDVIISWNSAPGQGYQLQYANNLVDNVWVALSPDITATDTITAVTNSMVGEPLRFYRVQLLPAE
jgi:hypothetical protein